MKGMAVCSTVSVTLWSGSERCGCVQYSKCYSHEVKVVAVCSALSVTLWWSKRCVAVCSTVLHYDQEVKDVLLCAVLCHAWRWPLRGPGAGHTPSQVQSWPAVQVWAGGISFLWRASCFNVSLSFCKGHHVSMIPCLSIKGIMSQCFLVFCWLWRG